jgi:hypothetical protein
VFKDDKTLVSFTHKKGESVMLLCTVHVGISVSEQTKKPEINRPFYNSTKSGVDSFDKLANNYAERNF